MMVSNLPKLDLHGIDREIAISLLNEFIEDNIILNNNKIVIVHGFGKGIIKKVVHEYLKKDKRVEKHYQDFYNLGATIVELKH